MKEIKKIQSDDNLTETEKESLSKSRRGQGKFKDDVIKDSIAGNLCRCTGFQQIVDSVKAASEILVSGTGIEDSTSPKSDPHPGFGDN